MERVINEAVRQTLLRVNTRLRELLLETKSALRGESVFGPGEVRKLRQPVEEMAPIMARSRELRESDPELGEPLDLYKAQLSDLQRTLEQVRVMLLARQASLEAGRAQLAAVAQWSARARDIAGR